MDNQNPNPNSETNPNEGYPIQNDQPQTNADPNQQYPVNPELQPAPQYPQYPQNQPSGDFENPPQTPFQDPSQNPLPQPSQDLSQNPLQQSLPYPLQNPSPDPSQNQPQGFLKSKRGKLIAALIALAFIGGIIFVTSQEGKFFKGQQVQHGQPPAKPELVYPQADTIIVKPFIMMWKDMAENDNGPQIKKKYQWKIFKEKADKSGPEENPTFVREWSGGTMVHGSTPIESDPKFGESCEPIDTSQEKNTWTCPYAGIGRENYPDLSPGTYYWQVEAGDGTAGSGWTELRKFTIVDKCPEDTALKKVSALLPEDSMASFCEVIFSKTVTFEIEDLKLELTKEIKDNQVILKWNSPSRMTKWEFKVDRSEKDNMENSTSIVTLEDQNFQYTDTIPDKNKTYFYQVIATNANPNKGPNDPHDVTSNIITAQATVLSPPANLSVKENKQSYGNIEINWTPSVTTGIDGYNVYKIEGEIKQVSKADLTNSTKKWEKFAPGGDKNKIIPKATEKIFDLVDLTKTWTYVMTSVKGNDESEPSNPAVYKPAGSGVQSATLAPPTDLKVAKNNNNGIDITWKNPDEWENLTGYKIYRQDGEVAKPKKEDLKNWKVLLLADKFPTPKKSESYINSDVDINKTYTYVITSSKGNDESDPSNVAVYKPQVASDTLNKAPKKPTLIAPQNNATVTPPVILQWKDEGDNDDKGIKDASEKLVRNFQWKIEEKEAAGTWKEIWKRDWHAVDSPALKNAETCKKDFSSQKADEINNWICANVEVPEGKLQKDKEYKWFVEAGDGNASSDWQEMGIFKVVEPLPETLSAPANLAAVVKYDATKKGVELTWDKVVNAEAYILYIKTGTQTKPPLADLKDTTKGWTKLVKDGKDKIENPADTTQKPNYFDNNPEKLTTDPLTYVVIAVKSIASAGGAAPQIKESDPSNVAVTNPAATQTPQTINLTATAGDKNVKLTWTDSNPAEKVGTYDVYRSTKTPVKTSDTETKYKTSIKPVAPKEFTDTEVVNGTTYYYIIIAGDKAGVFDVGISNEVTAKPVAGPDLNKQACDAGIVDLKTKKTAFDSNKTQANADIYNALYNQLLGKACFMPPETELPKHVTAPAAPPPPPVATGPSVNEITCQVKAEQLKDAYARYQVKPTEELADLYNTIRTSMQTLNCQVNSSFPASVTAQVIEPPEIENEEPPEVAEQPEPKTEIKYIYKEVPVAPPQVSVPPVIAAPVPMNIADATPAQVLHPVAGPKVPKETSDTGPEMWIYIVPALASAWGSRKILTGRMKKKRK